MSCFIIAEAGVNHNGSIDVAKKLIDVAYEAGCDAVKFQTFKAENIVTRAAKKAEYQIANTDREESQYEMIKKLELGLEDHKKLIEYCNMKGIMFLSTPFDEESVEMLECLGVGIYKIPSGEITNKPLIKKIAKKIKPIILSTGMSLLEEIEEALAWIYEEGNVDVTLLHCTSNYPTRMDDVNLKAMITLREEFKVKVGYSDHTLGIEVAVAAVALGADVIEKHFTLDKSMDGPDHKASLSPEELENMTKSIRNIECALGDGIKTLRHSEILIRDVVRKSIVSKENIKKGEKLAKGNITLKRPGIGIKPKYLENIIGLRAKQDIAADEIIQMDMLEKY